MQLTKWRFRALVAALVIVGVALLSVSLTRHHVPRDDEALPRVPAGVEPPPPRN